jgi:signal transduction histidine kinase
MGSAVTWARSGAATMVAIALLYSLLGSPLALAEVERDAGGDVDGGQAVAEGSPVENDARRLFEYASGRWRQRDPNSYLLFLSVPPDTAAGREARQVIERADEHYQTALEHLSESRDAQARQGFRQAMEVGPMDPRLYFDLAVLYDERGMRGQAVAYCGRFLAFMNQARESVDPDSLRRCTAVITGPEDLGPETPPPPESSWPLYLLVILGALTPIPVFLFIWFRRGKTLDELIDESPDLHPRIAYAIGCLRHELLKHRLGTLNDVVRGLRGRGGLTAQQRRYLRDRLYGGDSLSGLWKIYVETFDRLAGRRLYLDRRDRAFRHGWQAVQALEQLRGRFDEPDAGVADRLDAVRQQIRTFDRHLKWLSERLCRSKIDGQLLREAVFSVQGELRAAAVRLDEIRFGEPPPDVYIEVFRSDLLIVLKNLVRNAILALARQEESRRALGVEVGLRTEPTGDESVLIKVLDTSLETMTTEDIYGRRLDRGLGLVAAAVTRYDGSVYVEALEGDFTKAVVVRFFRALGEGER